MIMSHDILLCPVVQQIQCLCHMPVNPNSCYQVTCHSVTTQKYCSSNIYFTSKLPQCARVVVLAILPLYGFRILFYYSLLLISTLINFTIDVHLYKEEKHSTYKVQYSGSPSGYLTYQPQKRGGIYKKVTGSASDETDPRMLNSTVKRHSFLKTAYQE